MRLFFGLTKPRLHILGGFLSGEVEAIGRNVTKYKIGDEVFGATGMSFGAYAEYISLPEDGLLSTKPNTISHEEACTIPFGGATALHFLTKAQIKSGQKILIYGASGAVGTAAVQLAKYFTAAMRQKRQVPNNKLQNSNKFQPANHLNQQHATATITHLNTTPRAPRDQVP